MYVRANSFALTLFFLQKVLVSHPTSVTDRTKQGLRSIVDIQITDRQNVDNLIVDTKM
jgi:hypothetical protein